MSQDTVFVWPHLMRRRCDAEEAKQEALQPRPPVLISPAPQTSVQHQPACVLYHVLYVVSSPARVRLPLGTCPPSLDPPSALPLPHARHGKYPSLHLSAPCGTLRGTAPSSNSERRGAGACNEGGGIRLSPWSFVGQDGISSSGSLNVQRGFPTDAAREACCVVMVRDRSFPA